MHHYAEAASHFLIAAITCLIDNLQLILIVCIQAACLVVTGTAHAEHITELPSARCLLQ